MKQIETTSPAKLADLRAALADGSDRREVFLAFDIIAYSIRALSVTTPRDEQRCHRIVIDDDTLGSVREGR